MNGIRVRSESCSECGQGGFRLDGTLAGAGVIATLGVTVMSAAMSLVPPPCASVQTFGWYVGTHACDMPFCECTCVCSLMVWHMCAYFV